MTDIRNTKIGDYVGCTLIFPLAIQREPQVAKGVLVPIGFRLAITGGWQGSNFIFEIQALLALLDE